MSAVPLTDRGRRTRDALVVALAGSSRSAATTARGMGDIAEAAGVSHGTVYTWFATKDAVLMAVVESLVDGLYASLSTPESADALSRIDLANRRYLDAYREHARLLEVVEQAATTDETFRWCARRLRAAHVERVAATIRHLQVDGEARANLDAHAAAAALCAYGRGVSPATGSAAAKAMTRRLLSPP